jgi:hypothetical protein
MPLIKAKRHKGKGDSLFALKTGPNKSESMDLFFVLEMDSIKTNQYLEDPTRQERDTRIFSF